MHYLERAFKDLLKALWIFLVDITRILKPRSLLKRILSLYSLLGLALLYIVSIAGIILCQFKFPDKFDQDAPTIAIYVSSKAGDMQGEKLHAERLRQAAASNGWQVVYACFIEDLIYTYFSRYLHEVAASLVNLVYKPRFNIAVSQFINVIPYGYNIVYLNVPNAALFSPLNDRFKQPHLAEYDAYVDLYSVANGANPLLLKELARLGKPDSPIIPLYLTQNHVDYTPAKREQALIVGKLWGCGRGSLSLKLALNRLADEGLLVAYGIKEYFDFMGDGYKGSVEDYVAAHLGMKDAEGLIALQREYGISLAIHNLGHAVDMLPTGRIGESIVAGNIVICDQNGFATKFFGDNFLYIDIIAQEDKIYEQIKNHIEWIRSHPEEVERKAKAAYETFEREFLLENGLKTILRKVEEERKRFL